MTPHEYLYVAAVELTLDVVLQHELAANAVGRALLLLRPRRRVGDDRLVGARLGDHG